MGTFVIKTLGCKVNQFESEGIANYLTEKGWLRDEKRADVCIINTCTVTENASKQSKSVINQIVRNNNNSRVIVTGCFAQTSADEIRKIDGVTDVVSHFDKQMIPKLILESIKLSEGQSGEDKEFKEMPSGSEGMRTRPFLKIQDGCDSFCSYCIVPYTRGRSRSMAFENVVNNIRDYSFKGYHETVISGIHVGKYGKDLKEKRSLFDLIKYIDENKLIDRVRLGSVEPKEIDDNFINLIKDSDVVCKHFHIPLQSGDDNILKSMERPYDREYYRKLILKIKELIKDASIGTDIMVGFPGEDESAFENSYNLIKDLPVSYLHVFPYSKRKGTRASEFDNQVPETIKKIRADKLRDLGKRKREEFYRLNSGKLKKVLIEKKRDDRTGLLKGLTSNYITVYYDGDDSDKNKLVDLKLFWDKKNKIMIGSRG